MVRNQAQRMSPVGKYLALRTQAIRELGLVRILQACFANMARLKAVGSGSPNPFLTSGSTFVSDQPKPSLLLGAFGPTRNSLSYSQDPHIGLVGAENSSWCRWGLLGQPP